MFNRPKLKWLGIHPIDGYLLLRQYSANPNEFSLLQDDMVVEIKKITIGNDNRRDVIAVDGVTIGDGEDRSNNRI